MLVTKLLDLGRRPLAALDAVANRLYSWRFNPLYQSGTLVVVSFLVMTVTGLYLLLFYRIGAPYESMVRIEGQAFAGRWMRAMHRYASDLAVAASVLHALRMFFQGRTHGARTLAWISGLVLLFVIFACGWTGYVMLWDVHAQVLAVEGARLLDALPIFAEPIGRTFVGDRAIPSAFFFLNLFLHVALPVGLAFGLWLHVSRLARPVLLPPRPLLWVVVGLLFGASLVAPAPLGPEADLLAIPEAVDLDVFYAFWLPLSQCLAPGQAWLGFLAFCALLVAVPWWTRPPARLRGEPSWVNPQLCTGCEQCSLDCPYDAIAMVPLAERDGQRVGNVDPARCVSCGICTGSCAPMSVGPPGRTGRDELAAARAFLAAHPVGGDDVVLVACRSGAGRLAARERVEGALVFGVECGGHLHTSVLEFLLRSGCAGVLLAHCPPRDCRNREGPRWLDARIDEGREAELRESLDRRRLERVAAGEGEAGRVRAELAAFRARLAALGAARGDAEVALERECEPPAAEAS
jgi:coenzyme F420-reducing hydrogenase delta subunit/NAD-dependent dihydropyrimidine dehydrogenase PreA subunit